jgi:hypothetical protein
MQHAIGKVPTVTIYQRERTKDVNSPPRYFAMLLVQYREVVIWLHAHLPNAAIAIDKGCSRWKVVAKACPNRQQ